jgi:hypothetical protein
MNCYFCTFETNPAGMIRKIFAILYIVIATATFVACHSNTGNTISSSGSAADSLNGTVDKDAMPVITFEEDVHDFGKINTGERVTYAFKFKNTGKSVLVISNVSTSCGCTVSSYPKQPIKPGEESTLDISFNSAGKHGLQSKTITVYSNTEPPATTITIKAQVVEADNI